MAGLLFTAYLFVVVAPQSRSVGFDAFAYWAVDMSDPYRRLAGALGAFTYSPVAARAFAPAALLEWWQFLWLWLAVLAATCAWLGWRSISSVLAFPPVALDLYHGNVDLLLAAAIALGFRYPAAWALVLLTKVTPGVGLLWFLIRREWRSLGVALGITAVLVAVSVAVDGPLWTSWITEGLAKPATGAPTGQFEIPIPLLLRFPAAALLVGWGAWTDRPWVVPAGAALAVPILWPSSLCILAALLPIAQRRPGLTVPASRRAAGLTLHR